MTGLGKKIGCPGLVKMWWRILWRGRAAVIPSNWRTLVNSCRRSYTHWGVARKTAWRVDSVEDVGLVGGRDELKLTTETFVVELENTLTLRSRCWRKSAPRIGKETGANWNNQEPKRKGIILEPKQNNKEPSAVSRRTLEDRGARSWFVLGTGSQITHPGERWERNMWNRQAGKMHPPAGALVWIVWFGFGADEDVMALRLGVRR